MVRFQVQQVLIKVKLDNMIQKKSKQGSQSADLAWLDKETL